jgi:electron transfer flavoprotein beta subunit
MKAKKKPLEEVELDDLDLDEDEVVAKIKSVDIFLPPAKAAGKVLQGDSKQQVSELITLLRTEAKVI